MNQNGQNGNVISGPTPVSLTRTTTCNNIGNNTQSCQIQLNGTDGTNITVPYTAPTYSEEASGALPYAPLILQTGVLPPPNNSNPGGNNIPIGPGVPLSPQSPLTQPAGISRAAVPLSLQSPLVQQPGSNLNPAIVIQPFTSTGRYPYQKAHRDVGTARVVIVILLILILIGIYHFGRKCNYFRA